MVPGAPAQERPASARRLFRRVFDSSCWCRRSSRLAPISGYERVVGEAGCRDRPLVPLLQLRSVAHWSLHDRTLAMVAGIESARSRSATLVEIINHLAPKSKRYRRRTQVLKPSHIDSAGRQGQAFGPN